MKIKLFTLLFVLTSISFQAQIKTPQPSPTAKVEQKVGLTDVTLEYSRPSMRGRTIFGDLVPFGKKWRTGANANTKISFSTDVVIDGKTLKKGTYAIYTIPNSGSWEIIFYNDATNWGTPQKWDDSKVALKTIIKTNPMSFAMETFTMGFGDLADLNSTVLHMMWEQTSVGIKINVPTESIAIKSIEKTMAGPSANDYFSAATYYRTTGKDLNQALTWIDKAVAMNPDAYWMARQKSLIQADLGDKKGAISTAQKSLKLAEKAGNADYVKKGVNSIIVQILDLLTGFLFFRCWLLVAGLSNYSVLLVSFRLRLLDTNN